MNLATDARVFEKEILVMISPHNSDQPIPSHHSDGATKEETEGTLSSDLEDLSKGKEPIPNDVSELKREDYDYERLRHEFADNHLTDRDLLLLLGSNEYSVQNLKDLFTTAVEKERNVVVWTLLMEGIGKIFTPEATWRRGLHESTRDLLITYDTMIDCGEIQPCDSRLLNSDKLL